VTDPRPDIDRLRAEWLRLQARIGEQVAGLTAAAQQARAAAAHDPRLAELARELETKRAALQRESAAAAERIAQLSGISRATGRVWTEALKKTMRFR
jgi:hypothetical protein